MLNIIFLLIGFFFLVMGANKLVDGASALAARYKIPNIIIGLTLVAFGTSTPELFVNIFAALNHNSEIVLGNILGSNIFNILVILGVSALVYPLTVKTNTTWKEIPLAILSALVIFFMVNDVLFNGESSNRITSSEGIILLCFFSVFLAYNIANARSDSGLGEFNPKQYRIGKTIFFIIAGFVMLSIGGKLIVSSASNFARMLGISERIIALTIVSIGTSLPELVTSLVAVSRRNVDLAIGNVVGSNIFNVFFILGISSLLSTVQVNSAVQVDILVNIIASVLLFVFVFTGKGRRIERWEGMILLLIYIIYVIYIVLPK